MSKQKRRNRRQTRLARLAEEYGVSKDAILEFARRKGLLKVVRPARGHRGAVYALRAELEYEISCAPNEVRALEGAYKSGNRFARPKPMRCQKNEYVGGTGLEEIERPKIVYTPQGGKPRRE